MSDEELRALAEKATRGEWSAYPGGAAPVHVRTRWRDEEGRRCQRVVAEMHTQSRAVEDAAYIAAVSPDRILGLLDRLARVEALADEVEARPGYECIAPAVLRAALSEPTTRTTDPEESTR